jgi:hypothetical protein
LTRKHFPRFLIPPAARQLGIDHGVLKRSVPDPILYKAEIGAGVEQVGGDGVLESVEVPFALRDARELAIVLHEFIQSAAAPRRPAWGANRGALPSLLASVHPKTPAASSLQPVGHARAWDLNLRAA